MHTQNHFTFADGRALNRLGYGAMRLTGQPGNYGPYEHWAGGIALLRRAADLGVEFFDSAWAYGPETADRIVGEALEGRDVFIATKGGVEKPEPGRIGSRQFASNGSRATDKLATVAVKAALANLGFCQVDNPFLLKVVKRGDARCSLRYRQAGKRHARRGDLGQDATQGTVRHMEAFLRP